MNTAAAQEEDIANLARQATTQSNANRKGKYFDPEEGPRESMAIGHRPSVKEMEMFGSRTKRHGFHRA